MEKARKKRTAKQEPNAAELIAQIEALATKLKTIEHNHGATILFGVVP
jgi:hypothetical protein